MKKESKSLNQPSRPKQDSQEGEINRGRIFRHYFERLKYMYKTHTGLDYGNKK